MSEVHYKSATELISLLDAREIGARELLDHFLVRVERHNPTINAIIWQDADRARAEADASDRRRAAGEDTGPLDGLPVTVKECYDLAGSPTTWGVPEYSDNIADTDSAVVEKYRGAGAVVFGKTNVPFMLADWQSFNSIYGTCNNPWNLSRTPGGSSGGSGAALRRGADRVGRRLGYRRLDPQPGALLRGLRPQADLGDRLGPRPGVAGKPCPHRHRRRRPPGPVGGGPEAGLWPSGRGRRPGRAGMAADAAGAAQTKPAGVPRRRPVERSTGGGRAILPGRNRRARPLAGRRRRDRRDRCEARLPHRGGDGGLHRCCCAPRPPSG